MCDSVGWVSFCKRMASLESLAHGPPLSIPFSQLPGGQSQMLRAAKVFTKVTWVLTSASLLLLSLWLLLLSRALWRCLSSCRFFFSSRCCSRLCLFVTWKRRLPPESPARGHSLHQWTGNAGLTDAKGTDCLSTRTEKTHLTDQKWVISHYCSNLHLNLYPPAELANKINSILLINQFKMT